MPIKVGFCRRGPCRECKRRSAGRLGECRIAVFTQAAFLPINQSYSKEVNMEILSLEQELRSNAYPGRGIVIGKSADGTKAVVAYFIMGRSGNSRNRIFVEEGEGIRTEAFLR